MGVFDLSRCIWNGARACPLYVAVAMQSCCSIFLIVTALMEMGEILPMPPSDGNNYIREGKALGCGGHDSY